MLRSSPESQGSFFLLCYWVQLADQTRDDAVATVTARPGWFTRDEILARYAARAKRAVDGIAVYEVFAVFKLAVVIQQIYARYVRGQTDDPRFASLGRARFDAGPQSSVTGGGALMKESNMQVLFKSRPEGLPGESNFEIVRTDVPKAGEGEVLRRTIYLSVDPYMRPEDSGFILPIA